jgi:hypothetical protein
MNSIEKTLYQSTVPPGTRIQNSDKLSEFQQIDIARSKRAKRVIQKNIKNNNYELVKQMQFELLSHYENVDWWERESKFDFSLASMK